MAWVKLDDGFPEHPKVLDVGGDAAWLHVCALAFCNRTLTDGHIPRGMVGRLSDRKNARKLAEKLVEVGLWISTDDGWVINDYLDFQPSRESVLRDREERHQAKVAAGKKGGVASGAVRRGEAETKQTRSRNEAEPEAEPKQTVKQTGSRNEAPTRTRPENTSPPSPPTTSESPRRAAVVENFIRIGRDRHIATGNTIKSDRAFNDFMAGKARADENLDRWLKLFPTAPPDAIAAWLLGDKGSMRYYPRADELADVHELRPA